MTTYRLATDLSWARTQDDLAETFRLWDVNRWSIHCKLARRFADRSYQTREERRVELRYVKQRHEVYLEMDRQERAVDNLRVLYLAVEAMRLNERRGLAEVIGEAYLQLPPGSPRVHDPYEVLGVRPDTDMEVIEAAYRALAKKLHPDTGGSVEKMQELNTALERIKEERRVKP